MRVRIVAASLAACLLSLPAVAQDKVGVAACDDFLEKYEACVPKMPAASQQAVKDSIVQMRAAWKASATDAKQPDGAGVCLQEHGLVDEPVDGPLWVQVLRLCK
jgi:hypothetical protein